MSEMLNPQAGADELADKLAAISDISRNGVETLRTFMSMAGGDSLSLPEFISLLADCGARIFAQSDTSFELEDKITHDRKIPPFAAFHLQLICKEAMTNIRKHAAAGRVLLHVHADEEGVELSLQDDGRGFDSTVVGGKGRGLANMRSRAEKLGAGFTLTSEPGRGTQIKLSLKTP
jgi:signal transduction histidine kinase